MEKFNKSANEFINALDCQEVTTTNGMMAYKETSSKCVDLFFKAGAMRGKNIIPDFVAAYIENVDYAIRIALWLRDVRGGAGERELYKQILLYLSATKCSNRKHNGIKLINKTAELGRWDDLLINYEDKELKQQAFSLIRTALNSGNGLCAKWLPRKGQFARELREYLKLTPKAYRKLIVGLSDTVEQKMSSNEWSKINYSHVPSLAASRYQKAFNKKDAERYEEYKESLAKGDAKVNAIAVYPYDVVKSIMQGGDKEVSLAQWNSLPNFIGDEMILPMVDVSGSMTWVKVGNNKNLTPLDVALSLGLYLADKNTGVFKDVFLTFSENSELMKLQGNLLDKLSQMKYSDVGMSTNLCKAFDAILSLAAKNFVKQTDMPKYILILSDMQFNQASNREDNALSMMKRKYETYGYELPKIVFWNLNAHDNVPVKFNEQGVALVSGFSPSIMKSVLAAKAFSPIDIMLNTIMVDRYNY